MKGKLAVAAIVVLAAILITSPVLAAGSNVIEAAKQGPQKKPTVISMTGTIIGDPAGGTIQIRIQMTNYPFIKYRGTTQSVLTTSTTKYYLWDGKNRYPYSFLNLSDGDRVSINALVKDGVFTARRVQVNQPRIQIP